MAEDETDEEMDEETEDETEDNDSEGASGDEWKAPTKEEWERTTQALTKANGEAKKHRLALKKARENSSNASSGGSGADVEAIRSQAAKDAESKANGRVIRSEAKTALLGAGLADTDPESVRAAVRALDLEDLEVDEDGEVLGLDDAISDLKTRLPSLFKRTRVKGQVANGSRGTGGGQGGGTKPPAKSSASKLAAQLRG